MIAVAVMVLAAAPPQDSVVKLDTGFGFFVTNEGDVLTTHAGAEKLVGTHGLLRDGSKARVLEVELDDPRRGFAIIRLDGRDHPALELAAEMPDAGTRVVVIAQDDGVEGDIGRMTDDTLSLDAGELAGAPVIGPDGKVVGLLRGPGEAVRSDAILKGLKPPDARLRNLGISIAFFLGLIGWWRYRFRLRGLKGY